MREYSESERQAIIAERQAASILERLAAIESELFELRDTVKAPHYGATLREAVDTFHSAAWDAMSEAEKVVKERTAARHAAAFPSRECCAAPTAGAPKKRRASVPA